MCRKLLQNSTMSSFSKMEFLVPPISSRINNPLILFSANFFAISMNFFNFGRENGEIYFSTTIFERDVSCNESFQSLKARQHRSYSLFCLNREDRNRRVFL